MTQFNRRIERNEMKKKLKELKKENKDFKKMSLGEFKKYYLLLKASSREEKAVDDKAMDSALEDVFIDDVDEGDDQEDSSTE